MNREGIVHILSRIRAENVLDQGANIQCSCFLAPYRRGHKDKEDSTPSMGVLVDDQGDSKVHCFACSFGGSLERAVSTLQRCSGRDLSEVIREVALLESGDPEAIVKSIPEYGEAKAPIELYPEQVLGEMRGLAHPYILGRKFEVTTLQEWGIGYDRERCRVVLPVRLPTGELVGMVGRAVSKLAQPKYWNYFAFSRGRCLLGSHLFSRGDVGVVVEGSLDAPALWQCLRAEGVRGYSVVSTMGASVTKEQLDLIVRLMDEVVVFFDNDEGGEVGSEDVANRLSALGVRVRKVAHAPGGLKDAAKFLDEGLGSVAVQMVLDAEP